MQPNILWPAVMPADAMWVKKIRGQEKDTKQKGKKGKKGAIRTNSVQFARSLTDENSFSKCCSGRFSTVFSHQHFVE